MADQRTFVLVGERMIMCTDLCPRKGQEEPQVTNYSGEGTGIITDPPNSSIPLCHAPGAPLQFETAPAGGNFFMHERRACVLHAGADNIGMEELPKEDKPSLAEQSVIFALNFSARLGVGPNGPISEPSSDVT